ncbi:unnamed protein product [Gordionus sp. m RMFG-2023]
MFTRSSIRKYIGSLRTLLIFYAYHLASGTIIPANIKQPVSYLPFSIFEFESTSPFNPNTTNVVSCNIPACQCSKAFPAISIRCAQPSLKLEDLGIVFGHIRNDFKDYNTTYLDIQNKRNLSSPLLNFKMFLNLRQKIFKLKLSHDDIKEINVDTFEGFSETEVLDLSFNRLTNLEKGVFDSLLQLRALNLAFNFIEAFDSTSLLSKAYKMSTLDISYNPLDTLNLMSVSSVNNTFLTRLTEVSMTNTTLDSDKIASSLYFPSSVHTLYMDLNNFTILSYTTFIQIKKIKEVRLYGNPFVCDCSNSQLFGWLRYLLKLATGGLIVKSSNITKSSNGTVVKPIQTPIEDERERGIELVDKDPKRLNAIAQSLKYIQCTYEEKKTFVNVVNLTAKDIQEWCKFKCPFKGSACYCIEASDDSDLLTVKCNSSTYERVIKAGINLNHIFARLDLFDISFEGKKFPANFLRGSQAMMLMILNSQITEIPDLAFQSMGISRGSKSNGKMDIKHNHSMIGLSINDNNVKVINEKSFYSLNSLSRLSLAHNDISYIPPATFAHAMLPNLTFLDLSFNLLVDIRNVTFAYTLKDLNLRFNKIKLLFTASFTRLKSLEILYLTGNDFSCICEIVTLSVYLNELIQRFRADNYRANLTRQDLRLLKCQEDKKWENSTVARVGMSKFVLGLASVPEKLAECQSEVGNFSSGHANSSEDSGSWINDKEHNASQEEKEKSAKRWKNFMIFGILVIGILLLIIGIVVYFNYYRKYQSNNLRDTSDSKDAQTKTGISTVSQEKEKTSPH